jgi:hypothetical protein
MPSWQVPVPVHCAIAPKLATQFGLILSLEIGHGDLSIARRVHAGRYQQNDSIKQSNYYVRLPRVARYYNPKSCNPAHPHVSNLLRCEIGL